jgi:hypothetical protein
MQDNEINPGSGGTDPAVRRRAGDAGRGQKAKNGRGSPAVPALRTMVDGSVTTRGEWPRKGLRRVLAALEGVVASRLGRPIGHLGVLLAVGERRKRLLAAKMEPVFARMAKGPLAGPERRSFAHPKKHRHYVLESHLSRKSLNNAAMPY